MPWHIIEQLAIVLGGVFLIVFLLALLWGFATSGNDGWGP